ncbi:hypothetical protein FF100_31145 [Methylobacterium terricola]|uniref:Uncharacterized protein n=1 Tax=Methylobacterium terricola TaxID=2583531 RepID=A0A5C4L9Y1_9HYPH|nr:hypothetical protein [Methylobacterium terricola]TNC07798.1 hypothetical protein FF100_31145 [Methylobacterium terricola]
MRGWMLGAAVLATMGVVAAAPAAACQGAACYARPGYGGAGPGAVRPGGSYVPPAQAVKGGRLIGQDGGTFAGGKSGAMLNPNTNPAFRPR